MALHGRKMVLGMTVLLMGIGITVSIPLSAEATTKPSTNNFGRTPITSGIGNLSFGMAVALPSTIQTTTNQTNLLMGLSQGLLKGIQRGSARTTVGLLSLLPSLGPRLDVHSNLPSSKRDPGLHINGTQVNLDAKEPMPPIRTNTGSTYTRAWFSIPFGS